MFTLALALGMPVSEIESRVSSRELAEWMAYYQLDPFGNERGDYQAGTVAAAVLNAQRRKGQRAAKPSEFVPDYGRSRKRKTNAEMWAVLNAFKAAHNKALESKK